MTELKAGSINVQPQLGPRARVLIRRYQRLLAGATDNEELAKIREKFLQKAALYGKDIQPARVSISILSDLRIQGWDTQVDERGIWSKPPERNRSSPEGEKERLREAHLHERDNQLRQRATREFIKDLERQRLGPKGWASIFSVMRDGCELAAKLRLAAVVPNGLPRYAELKKRIAPYLQIVDGESRCPWTGLRLADIWRYFRHTWTTPYNNTPGRKIWILVRDAAGENHPVIGIAAIGSAVVQLSARDAWIGWRSKEFLNELRRKPSAKWARWVRNSLRALIANIFKADFLSERLITPSELRYATERTVAKLLGESDKVRKRHQKYPKPDEHKGRGQQPPTQWKRQAHLDLFRAKRAETLAELLGARRKLQEAGFRSGTRSELRKALGKADGRRAIESVLKHVKASHVGIDMLDIIVCGAIPPYNSILGGKLVSLLLTSPEISQAYARRYAHTPSVIASSMAGRAIRRPPRLVLLGTTSLYHVNPSQYNRLRIEASEVGGKKAEWVRFERLGETEGFGSYHLSQATVKEIEALLAQSHPGTRVNSIFGEGVNPRLRKIRSGLDLLGVDSNGLLNHRSPRVVYGIRLAENFRDVLLGFTRRPKYILPQSKPKEVTTKIADFWIRRWLGPRITNEKVLAEVSRHSLVHPVQHGARVFLPGLPEESSPLPFGS